MDYKRHYDLLIARAKTRQLTGYIERHHIVPRCIGGTNAKSNLVELTPEEHYVAHQLLVKIYPNNDSLVYAANRMTVSSKFNKRNNKQYGWLKKRYQTICKKRIGNKNPSFGRSWYYDPETLNEGKFLLEEVPSNWIKGRKSLSKENNKCISCGNDTNSKKANWCNACRRIHGDYKKSAIKQIKTKNTFTLEEKKEALIANCGSIRKALFSLGLNDSGAHYKIMKEIKASVYPLATNQLKG